MDFQNFFDPKRIQGCFPFVGLDYGVLKCKKLKNSDTPFVYTVRASTFSRTELLAYRTEPCYIGTPKKSSFHQKLFGLPKVRFGTVREKVRFVKNSMRVLY